MIKILPAILVFVFYGYALHAQMEKGNRLIGASMEINIRSEDDNRSVSRLYNSKLEQVRVGVYPYMGFFIKDGLAIGGLLQLYSDELANNSTNLPDRRFSFSRNEKLIGASVFLKKTNTIKGRLGFYIQSEFGYSFRWLEDLEERIDVRRGVIRTFEGSSNEVENTLFMHVSGGIYYFISDQFSVEADILSIALDRIAYTKNQISDTSYSDNRNRIREFRESEGSSFNLSSNLTNRFSLSKILIINYYF